MTDPKRLTFFASCPFLFCNRPLPHSHGICPSCEAVRFGNVSCATCRELRPDEDKLEEPYRSKSADKEASRESQP